MTMAGMYLLRKEGYEEEKTKLAIQMLLIDKKNEFRELSDVIFSRAPNSMQTIPNKEEFILNFCFDVSEAFKTWIGFTPLESNSARRALSILRVLGRDKTTVNGLVRLLNICYDIAEDFKVIYKRIG